MQKITQSPSHLLWRQRGPYNVVPEDTYLEIEYFETSRPHGRRLGKKTTEGWITFKDPTYRLVFGKYEPVYVNVRTRRVLWKRIYETAAEKYARQKREAKELQEKLDTP